MNKFLILWSLISPSCLVLISSALRLTGLSWIPTSDIKLSVIIYFTYWVLLGILQGALLLKFQYKILARKWFLTTSTTGFSIMLCHDLCVLPLGTNGAGVGMLYLGLTLPVLAVLGGFMLGATQFLLLKNYYEVASQRTGFIPNWFAVSFISWIISFVGILFGSNALFAIIFLSTVGTALKGYAVMKYLRP